MLGGPARCSVQHASVLLPTLVFQFLCELHQELCRQFVQLVLVLFDVPDDFLLVGVGQIAVLEQTLQVHRGLSALIFIKVSD